MTRPPTLRPGLLAAALVLSLRIGGAEEPVLAWHDPTTWGLEGQGWSGDGLAAPFDRLPSKAERIVRPAVWNLSRHSAGICFRFNTDAAAIHLRYEVGGERLAMPHMPATGVSGVDLYALDDGVWKWVDVTRPKERSTTHAIEGLEPVLRTYLAYLPLYNSTTRIEVGVPEGAAFEPVAPRTEKPIVFYGTSITHGACASRPGMAHPAILGRRLGLPVINLGFSGNGKMEPEIGALIAEIDAAAYVIDCLPNMVAEEVEARTAVLVEELREIRPDTPILLVEDRTYANAWIRRSLRERHASSRAALIRAYEGLVTSGRKGLIHVPGDPLLGDDTEGTTDGSHPNDLGFQRHADALEPILRQALGME